MELNGKDIFAQKRLAVHLKDIEGYSNKELADILETDEKSLLDISFVMIVSGPKGSAVMEIVGEFDVKDISKLSVIGQKK